MRETQSGGSVSLRFVLVVLEGNAELLPYAMEIFLSCESAPCTARMLLTSRSRCSSGTLNSVSHQLVILQFARNTPQQLGNLLPCNYFICKKFI
jgi:hypothetical protein